MKHTITNLGKNNVICVLEKDGNMTTVKAGETRVLDIKEIKTPSYSHFSIEPHDEPRS